MIKAAARRKTGSALLGDLVSRYKNAAAAVGVLARLLAFIATVLLPVLVFLWMVWPGEKR